MRVYCLGVVEHAQNFEVKSTHPRQVLVEIPSIEFKMRLTPYIGVFSQEPDTTPKMQLHVCGGAKEWLQFTGT